jgi:phosphocarrier protein HPr
VSTKISKKVHIGNDLGLHLRAAGALVQRACGFQAEITVRHGRIEANAKSIMSVLSLAAAKGVELELEADGPDAAAAVHSLQELIEAGFHV